MALILKEFKEQLIDLIYEVLEEEISEIEKELEKKDASQEFADKNSVIKMIGDDVYEDSNDPSLFKATRPADELPPEVDISNTRKREF